MRVAVSGASGHLGNVICRQLLEAGHEVNALYNSDKRALEDLDINLFQGSIFDRPVLDELMSECDALIHCAAIISIDGDPTGIVHETNTQGVREMTEACKRNKVKKMVHVSSTHAIQEEPLDEPLREDRAYKTEAAFAYDYSKATGEKYFLEELDHLLEGCIVRPSSIVGPYDFKPSKLAQALLDLRSRKVPMLPPGGYDFVDVREVAKSCIEAIEKGRNKEIYFLTGKYHTIKEIANSVRRITGVKVPQRIVPFWMMKLALPFAKMWAKIKKASPSFTIESITVLKMGHQNIDHSKADKELGHGYRELEESVRDFFNWWDNK